VLLSGLHTVSDIHCRSCRALLGWKYLGAFTINHRPKIGRYVLEKGLIVKLRGGGKAKRPRARKGQGIGAGLGYGSGLSGETARSRRGVGGDDDELDEVAAESSQL